MATIKSILFTIVASFILLAEVQSETTETITLNEYLGVWYQVGVFLPKNNNSAIMCEIFNAKIRYDCDECFTEKYGKLINGQDPSKSYGYGRIADSKMNVMYPEFGRAIRVYDIENFEDGHQLILRDRSNEQNTKLLSRGHTASYETRLKFEKVANDVGLHAVYVDPIKCPSF